MAVQTQKVITKIHKKIKTSQSGSNNFEELGYIGTSPHFITPIRGTQGNIDDKMSNRNFEEQFLMGGPPCQTTVVSVAINKNGEIMQQGEDRDNYNYTKRITFNEFRKENVNKGFYIYVVTENFTSQSATEGTNTVSVDNNGTLYLSGEFYMNFLDAISSTDGNARTEELYYIPTSNTVTATDSWDISQSYINFSNISSSNTYQKGTWIKVCKRTYTKEIDDPKDDGSTSENKNNNRYQFHIVCSQEV